MLTATTVPKSATQIINTKKNKIKLTCSLRYNTQASIIKKQQCKDNNPQIQGNKTNEKQTRPLFHPPIRYVVESENTSSQPVCPLTKSCFQRKNSKISMQPKLASKAISYKQQKQIKYGQINGKRMYETIKLKKSQSCNGIPSYRYKSADKNEKKNDFSNKNVEFSKIKKSGSLSKSIFLKCAKIKKQKIPVNILAQQSVINGQLADHNAKKQNQNKILFKNQQQNNKRQNFKMEERTACKSIRSDY